MNNHSPFTEGTALKKVEEDIEVIAEKLEACHLRSHRLARFLDLLRTLQDGPSGNVTSELDRLEREFHQLWTEYLELDISAEEITAESVVGHRYLEEAFALWFDALHAARESHLEVAWSAANEGNRLLIAVSEWSDQIRGRSSIELGQA